MRVTLTAINKAIKDAGLNCELVKGYGYFYIQGPDADCAQEQGVYGVRLLSDLSIDRWVEEAKERCEA